jgi:hypothetical protein
MNSGSELKTAMENSYDCGPSMLASDLQTDIRTIKDNWPVKWCDFDNFLDNMFDFPGMHFIFLHSNGFKFRLLESPAPDTCCLLHFGDSVYSKLMKQHWVVFIKELPDGTTYELNWGRPHSIVMDKSVFNPMLDGFPRFMYKIGEEETSKWNRCRIFFWKLLSYILLPILKFLTIFR